MEEKPSNPDISQLSKEVGKGSFFFGIAGSLEQILAFLLSWIVVRVLSDSDYGLYGLVNSYYAIALSITLMTSFRNIVIKYIGNHIDNREKINQIISTQLVYGIFSLIFIITFFFIAFEFNLFFEPELLLPLLIISTNVVLSIVEIGILFVGLRQFKTYNIWKMILVSLHFIITLGFFLFFNYFTSIPGYYGIFLGQTVFGITMIFITLYFICKNYGKFWNSHLLIKEIMVESIIYGLISMISGLIFTIEGPLIEIFVNDLPSAQIIYAHFSNVMKTGINFSRIISILIGSMLMALLTPLIQNKDFNKAEKLIGKIDKILFYILSSLMIIVAIAPKETVFFLYGENYVQDSPYLYFSFFIVYISVIGVSIDASFIISNKLNYLFIINIIKILVLLLLSYPLMALYTPFIGMLLSLGASLVITMIIMVIFSSKVLSINYWKYIKKIFLLGSFMIIFAIIVEYFLNLNIFTKITLMLIFLVIYNVLIIITGVINKEDIQMLKSLFQNEKFGRILTPILKILDKIPFKEK